MDEGIRRELSELFMAGVEATAPRRLVSTWLRQHPLRASAVISVGKAAPAMAFGAIEVLGPLPGLVITNRRAVVPRRMRLVVSGHPVPNQASLEAGSLALALAGELGPGDHLLVLLSGGASALMEAPRGDLTIEELAATTDVLLRSGADIDSMNAIRRELSLIKGGGLAHAAGAAEITTLAISDVVSEDPSVIGSGPTVAVPGAAAGLRVAEILGIAADLPAKVRQTLAEARDVAATSLERYTILASGATAAAAVAHAARARGHTARVVTTELGGEAREAARWALATARTLPETACVFSGETTVTVRGSGRGGRNQEAALAAAIDLAQTPGLAFLAAGSDGIDGPTDAAGAIVDGTTVDSMVRVGGVDPAAALDDNDSATALEAAGARLVIGDTGTNVGDIWITLRP